MKIRPEHEKAAYDLIKYWKAPVFDDDKTLTKLIAQALAEWEEKGMVKGVKDGLHVAARVKGTKP